MGLTLRGGVDTTETGSRRGLHNRDGVRAGRIELEETATVGADTTRHRAETAWDCGADVTARPPTILRISGPLPYVCLSSTGGNPRITPRASRRPQINDDVDATGFHGVVSNGNRHGRPGRQINGGAGRHEPGPGSINDRLLPRGG